MIGQIRPGGLLENVQNPVAQLGGCGEFRAIEDRHLRRPAGVARHLHGQFAQAFIAHHLAAHQEGVPGGQGGGEPFLDLAQRHPAPPLQAHLQRFGVDDRADVLPDHRRRPRVAQLPPAIPANQPLPAVIGAQGIAPGGGIVEAGIEIGAAQPGIGPGLPHFVEQVIRTERPRTGHDQDLLAQHVQRPRPARFSIQIMRPGGLQRGQTFHHLEAVGRHQPRLGRRVVAVVRPPDPLHQPLDVLGRANLDHQIDIAPVDAKVERAGADHGAQLPGRHRRLDLCALLPGQ